MSDLSDRDDLKVFVRQTLTGSEGAKGIEYQLSFAGTQNASLDFHGTKIGNTDHLVPYSWEMNPTASWLLDVTYFCHLSAHIIGH